MSGFQEAENHQRRSLGGRGSRGGLFPSALEFVEPRYDDGRVKAAREVRIDKGHANGPQLVDQEGPRHRQVPRVSAVERGQIRAHLFVRAAHRFSNGENESKLARHLVAHIAQERKGQFQLAPSAINSSICCCNGVFVGIFVAMIFLLAFQSS